jgi:DNA-binding MarR family transcriptional regulator
MTEAFPSRSTEASVPPEGTLASYIRAFPDADTEAIATHLVLAAASGNLTRGIERTIQGLGFELSRPRYTILRSLYLSPDQMLPQSEIAQSMRVSGANVTQLIDALVADGWVERIASPTDRRVTYAKLTDAGRERCEVLVPAVLEFMIRSTSSLTQDEQAELRRLVEKVTLAIQPQESAD